MPSNPLIPTVLQEDLPLYPPILQLLRVTEGRVDAPSGVVQTGGSSVLGPSLYVAFVQQLRTDGLLPRDREPCLVDDVNGTGLLPGFYLGRLAGSHTSLPVYEVGAAGAVQADRPKFAKCLVTDPTDDMYSARLQEYGDKGSLLDTGNPIWLREAQNMGRMIETGIYHVHRTGYANGRDVYTVADFILIVGNATLSQTVLYAHLMLFSPNRCWTIATLMLRTAQITRIFEVCRTGDLVFADIFRITFDPASNWEVDDTDDDGNVIVRRVLNVYEGTSLRTTYTWGFTFDDIDFSVTAAGAGYAAINTKGFTGSFDVLTNCVAGVLKVRCLTFTRGLLKTVGAERDLGSGSCP